MERAPFVIYRFYTKYEPDRKDPAKMREIDMVEIGPLGLADKHKIPLMISEISRVQDLGGSTDNPAIAAAHMRWNYIRPRYEAWKNNQQVPENGTPLAAWNGITPEQADVFKSRGIRTVEDIATMTDGLVVSFPFPNMRAVREQAKRFIESADQVRVAASLAQKDEEISNLKEMISELAERMSAAEKPKRGRPKKSEEAQEEEAA